MRLRVGKKERRRELLKGFWLGQWNFEVAVYWDVKSMGVADLGVTRWVWSSGKSWQKHPFNACI